MTDPLTHICERIIAIRRLYDPPVRRDDAADQMAQALDVLIAELEAGAGTRPSGAPALNAEGEELHTGDDLRIDAVTSIRASLEAIIEAYNAGEAIDVDGLHDALQECDALDKLLIETIQREAAAARPLE